MAARGELVFIRNIPDRFRSSALRLFFEEAIEAKFFKCFHYRHRPENVHFGVTLGGSTPGEGKGTGKTCCCVVDVKSPQDVERFITEFNFKPWVGCFSPGWVACGLCLPPPPPPHPSFA